MAEKNVENSNLKLDNPFQWKFNGWTHIKVLKVHLFLIIFLFNTKIIHFSESSDNLCSHIHSHTNINFNVRFWSISILTNCNVSNANFLFLNILKIPHWNKNRMKHFPLDTIMKQKKRCFNSYFVTCICASFLLIIIFT